MPKSDSLDGNMIESRIELRAYMISIIYDKFKEACQHASNLAIKVRDLEIIDNITSSLWRKFLSHLRAEMGEMPRERGSDMLRVEMTYVRPDLKNVNAVECRFKVTTCV